MEDMAQISKGVKLTTWSVVPAASVDATHLPYEFDLRHARRGFTMRGWDFTRAEIADAIRQHRMLNPAMELGSNVCVWNCAFCFTEHPDSPIKRRLSNEMTLDERLSLVDQAADLGARTINWVGAGEPSLDPHFWTILERMRERDVTPIVYTEGTLRLSDRASIRRLYECGATVVLKVNSLWNHAYQNSIVRGAGRNPKADEYTRRRNEVLEFLLEAGFANSEPTRLAFDTIITRQNIHEIPALHRYAREHNIFVLFVNYLPSGRSADGVSDAVTRAEQVSVFEDLARIDADEYGLFHASKFPYAGGVPCSIRGTGLFVKITGKTYDCPGEMVTLGDVRVEPLAEVWDRARPISRAFNGGCAPREEFWRQHGQGADENTLQ